MTASKKDRILELFFNEPTKHWHFSDIVKTADVSESTASVWLNKLLEEQIIVHKKPKGRMPYFQANWEHPNYKAKKRVYALRKMHDAGLLSKLMSLKKAKTVVIFGSFARSDWNTESDVDVFVYGEPEDQRFGGMWEDLGLHGKGREVQVHTFKSKEDIEKIRSGLISNVIEGYFVKGSVNDLLEAAA